MDPQTEKLEQLFSQGKTDAASLQKFYDEFWIAVMLDRPDMSSFADRLLEWVRQQVPPQTDNLAMASVVSAFMAFHEGNYEASLLILAEAGKLFTAINDTEGAAVVTAMEGFNYRVLGDLALALRRILDGYQVLSETNRFRPFVIFCLYQMAGIYSDTEQYDEALKYYQVCEKFIMASEPVNKVMLSRSLNGIGMVYQHQKEYTMALDYLTHSLKLAQEINSLRTIAKMLTDLGSYYSEMGDNAKATDYQQQALTIRNDRNIQIPSITNMILLADIAVKSGKPDEAIDLLNKALPIAEEQKVKQKIFQIHLMLSEIYESKGNFMKSLFHYKSYHSVREEVQHEDNEKKIKNLQLIFEAEQTKKENVIIKAQKVEIENKNQQLQETIDELTITKVSRKAKVLTFVLGITLIVAQDPIFNIVLNRIGKTIIYSPSQRKQSSS